MVSVVRWLMIMAAIVVYPFYRLWLVGGKFADARERRRRDYAKSSRVT